jgi:putative transposase
VPTHRLPFAGSSIILLRKNNDGGWAMTEQELRRRAIDRFKNGEPPKAIYSDLGRTKQWFFKWLKRYQSGDPKWYVSRSTAPHRKPKQIQEDDRRRIIAIREQLQHQSFSQIGVSAIKWELHKARAPIPSDRTINRVLKQEGLVKKNILHPQGS